MRVFSNWPQVALWAARASVTDRSLRVSLRSRGGESITLAALPDDCVPGEEVLATDPSDLRWILGDLIAVPINALDIGAHVGVTSCWLGALHPGARVDCFDPSPRALHLLSQNIAANGLEQRVIPHRMGSGHDRVTIDDAVRGVDGAVSLVRLNLGAFEHEFVYLSSPASWQDVQRMIIEYTTAPGEPWEALRAWFAGVGLHVVRNAPRSDGTGTAWLSRTPLDDPVGPRPSGRIGHLAYQARRVVQTPRVFANWPRVLVDIARERLGRGPAEVTFVTRTGLRLTTPNLPGARLPAFEQFAEDSYRLRWFLGELRGHPLHAIDVGAHVGTFACMFTHLHGSATLTCFEPSSRTADHLKRNIAQNGLDERVQVEVAALTGKTGSAMFDEHGGASVHSGLVHGATTPRASAVEVRTLGFDDVVASSPAPIVFVKLDCEGGEYAMAYASSPESWASVQRLVLEYHDIPNESWAELRAWFATAGLHVVWQERLRTDLGTAWLSRGTVN